MKKKLLEGESIGLKLNKYTENIKKESNIIYELQTTSINSTSMLYLCHDKIQNTIIINVIKIRVGNRCTFKFSLKIFSTKFLDRTISLL